MSDIGFVLLYVEEVARSAEFYSRLLEKPIVESLGHFRDDSGGARAHAGPLAARWSRAERDGQSRRGEIAVTLADAAAVDAAHARWSAQAPIAQPPTKLDFGYTFVALDPDGHRVRVFAPASD